MPNFSTFFLFGSGFLAVTTNSYQHELDADRYAAEWAYEKGWIKDFIRGIEIMDVAARGLRERQPGLGLAGRRGQIDEIGGKDQTSWIVGLKRKFDMLFEFYFGEESLSYIHRPVEERIMRIRALTGI